jgi:ankyrin repeat protein
MNNLNNIVVYLPNIVAVLLILFIWHVFKGLHHKNYEKDLVHLEVLNHINFTKLPFELFSIVLEVLDVEDLISLDQAYSCSKSTTRCYLLKCLKAMKMSFWQKKRITNIRSLRFIIHRSLLEKWEKQNDTTISLQTILKIDLTATAVEKRESNLHYSVRNGLCDVVSWLIMKYGDDPNQVDNRGRCPLALCCLSNEYVPDVLKMCQVLIDCRADPNYPNNLVCNWTPMHYCALKGATSIAKLLITHSTTIALDGKDSHGRSALSYACEYGRTELARLITDKIISNGGNNISIELHNNMNCNIINSCSTVTSSFPDLALDVDAIANENASSIPFSPINVSPASSLLLEAHAHTPNKNSMSIKCELPSIPSGTVSGRNDFSVMIEARRHSCNSTCSTHPTLTTSKNVLLAELPNIVSYTTYSAISAAIVACASTVKSASSYANKRLSDEEIARKREQELMFHSERECRTAQRSPPSPPRSVFTDLEKDELGYTPLHFAASKGNYDVMLLLLSKIAESSAPNNTPAISPSTTIPIDSNSVHSRVRNTTSGNIGIPFSNQPPPLVDIQDARGRSALHLACLHGHTNIAALLASKTHNIDLMDARGKTALHFACEMGHISIATLLAVDYNANTAAIMCR